METSTGMQNEKVWIESFKIKTTRKYWGMNFVLQIKKRQNTLKPIEGFFKLDKNKKNCLQKSAIDIAGVELNQFVHNDKWF